LRLRLSSRGDGLRFLKCGRWTAADESGRKAGADLEVHSVRRQPQSQPVANGFLRFPRAARAALWAARRLRQLESNDFLFFRNKLRLVQELGASRGVEGRRSRLRRVWASRGHSSSANPLVCGDQPSPGHPCPRSMPTSMASWESGGSLSSPWRRRLQVSKGASMAQPGGLAAAMPMAVVEPAALAAIVQQLGGGRRWDFPKQPLVLFGVRAWKQRPAWRCGRRFQFLPYACA